MNLSAELPLALRRLRRHPGFTLTTIGTLAAGLGATLAMFAVVYGVVLNPLPYPAANRLVWLDHAAPGVGAESGLGMTQGLYLHYREASRRLGTLAVYADFDLTLTENGPPRRLTATITTPELAAVLQQGPALGRFLVEADATPGAPPVAVLSHALWRSAYGADSAILGQSATLDGIGVAVVGIMPPSFAFPTRRTDLWLARPVNPAGDTFGSFSLSGVARLAPLATSAAARRELNDLIPRLIERFPGPASNEVVHNARLAAVVTPLKDAVVGNVAATLWVLLGTVALVLLIAAVNVANLLVVRAEGRRREMSVRVALGAGPRALAVHSLAEAAWLAGASGALAVPLATIALGLVRRFGPTGLPRIEDIGFTAPVWGAALVLSAAAGLMLAALPVIARRGGGPVLTDAARATVGPRRFRARNALVASQTAFALVLVVGAGLMARSFWHLTRLDPGFDPDGVLTFQLSLPGSVYTTPERAATFHEALLSRLRALPGVTGAGGTTCLPLCGRWSGIPWVREDRPARPGEVPPVVATRRVSWGYLEAMHIDLLRGRGIEREDGDQRTGAVVINRRAAAKLFPGEDPIGKRIYPGRAAGNPAWYHVVGIVENAPVRSLTDDPAPVAYLAMLHQDASGPGTRQLAYAVRTSRDPMSLVDAIRVEVGTLDASLPLTFVRPMTAIVREASAGMAFTMVLLVLAAAMALFLGVVGIYSVVAYLVAQRRSEFGIRLAIGARSQDLTRLVLKQGGMMVAAGTGLGLAGALGLTRFMRAMVFGVSVTDPGTYLAVTTLLAAVAFLAILGPARRAGATDAVESLRAG